MTACENIWLTMKMLYFAGIGLVVGFCIFKAGCYFGKSRQ